MYHNFHKSVSLASKKFQRFWKSNENCLLLFLALRVLIPEILRQKGDLVLHSNNRN